MWDQDRLARSVNHFRFRFSAENPPVTPRLDGDENATDATWRSSSELDPLLAVMAGQRVEEFLRASIEQLIAGLAR